ncbi:hypothetical protein GMORB2_3312 [Geosmithia morbida]|uniref:Stress-associated endoplasmic reticulum protein n=1 Tax=Geosmithia morbida TaxID=1094350 RepID=A0A9P5D1V6_9HYPO|nr:uncharacterized protein GMORB2_3312 [Geosmithia morbida]KAF4120185.1 hypothetical protein GMORB2_3312 [Geosmithia morbida]
MAANGALEQRRRNAKFAKKQENRMGKSEEQLKTNKAKVVRKSPISPVWMSPGAMLSQ